MSIRAFTAMCGSGQIRNGEARDSQLHFQNRVGKLPPNVRFGSKADISQPDERRSAYGSATGSLLRLRWAQSRLSGVTVG